MIPASRFLSKLPATSLMAASAASAQEAPAPLSYLWPVGQPAGDIAEILWGLIALAVAVVVVIAALVIFGLRRARRNVDLSQDTVAVRRQSHAVALRWIYGGLLATAAILIAFTVWTIETLAGVVPPGRSDAALSIRIVGHQWWWEARYEDDDPSQVFSTANEIWIPARRRVRFELVSEDVIHTFWVPALGGKTDLIPGRVNIAWFQADVPGIFRGQCNEYCGLQHAHMGMRIFAVSESEFEDWRAAQLKPAGATASAEAAKGQQVFLSACASCHTVRGTVAGGKVGPDLTHLMSRTTLAAATLPNTKGHLAGWIANPQALKPGTPMPNPALSGPELEAVRSYLATLE